MKVWLNFPNTFTVKLYFKSLQGSLRTGSVFRAIARYLATSETEVFQFENVTTLAAKPIGKADGSVLGPSNLSAVVAVLRHEAKMWSHVWQLDSRDFGSGQQRQRLWGSCFRLQDLHMSESAAHDLLNSTMDTLVGVEPCHPSEYLLGENEETIKGERSRQALRALVSQDNKVRLNVDTLFQTGGAVSVVGTKKPRLCKQSSNPSPPSAKWVQNHAKAFRDQGLESLC